MRKEYITEANAWKTFRLKPPRLQQLINEALHLLVSLGLPITGLSPRRLEKMAIAFLAVVDVRDPKSWSKAKDLSTPRALQSKEIVRYWRDYFNEAISDGSYDDVRRADLLLPFLSGIIITDDPTKDINDSTRRYALNPEYSDIVRQLGAASWQSVVDTFVKAHGTLAEKLDRPRHLSKIPVLLSSGESLSFVGGPHNELQKKIIEEFLPRFGFGAEVLYVGDTADRYFFVQNDKLQELKFFNLKDAKLPDVVAYSHSRNWIYLIEAVHSANPMTPERRLVLAELLRECTASPIYVTAFLDKSVFKRFAPEIAWETEVWITSDPDHLIHFNGDKFLGPSQTSIRR